jgi:DNA invertase Pin-like site-specific DNA recombinase
MATKAKEHAVAYIRTSSAANVGDDKDSEKRQRIAITEYAKRSRLTIAPADWFPDAAVKGADPIDTRPGFAALLARIESNGVRLVIVEDASRFARDLVTQELGILSLIELGVRVVTAGGLDLTETDDPFKIAMRQIAGAFAQLEKARLVAKLKGARDRKRAKTGKCEGRKSLAEKRPEVVAAARELKEGRSLRQVSAELAALGHTTPSGAPYSASAVAAMVAKWVDAINEFETSIKAERKREKGVTGA